MTNMVTTPEHDIIIISSTLAVVSVDVVVVAYTFVDNCVVMVNDVAKAYEVIMITATELAIDTSKHKFVSEFHPFVLAQA